jgi:hypothetical protein
MKPRRRSPWKGELRGFFVFYGTVLSWEKRVAKGKKICVIDGQGGGIGKTMIKAIKARYGETVEVWGLGTNAIATGQMLKAGANRGATGENAIVRSVKRADLVIGSVSVTWPNAMLGEVTTAMAEAVMDSKALKILLPLSQEHVKIVGFQSEPLPHMVKTIVEDMIKEEFFHV